MARFEYIVKNLKRSNPRSVRQRVMLRIDGEVLNDGYVLDTGELARSFYEQGEFWFLTCSCGEPGCAGLGKPFQVEFLENGVIHWHVTHPGPERDFFFARDQAVSELQKAGILPRPRPLLPTPLPPLEDDDHV